MRRKKIRFLFMILTGMIISAALHTFGSGDGIRNMNIPGTLLSVLITLLVWEGNLRIGWWMNIKYPWLVNPWKRILFQFTASTLYSAVIIFVFSLLFQILFYGMPADPSGSAYFNYGLLVLGILVLFSLIMLSIEINIQFFRNWKLSQLDNEKIRAEYLQARLQNLINQVNPHFLFNNLSVLSSLVYKDQDKAVTFINQLSRVYRYLLDTRNNEMVILGQELDFILSYIYLLKIRFGDKIQVEIETTGDLSDAHIPQMALQILLENAIKHNEATADRPLKVSLKAEKGTLTVTNNIQLRNLTEPGSKTGLQNIIERYRFFTDTPVEVIDDGIFFIVKIPLLNKQ